MSLNIYLKKWNLLDPELIAQTDTSKIYRVTHDKEVFILKHLTELGVFDEGNSAKALAYFNGVGAIKLVEHDENAQLIEYAPGRNLKELVLKGRDREATEIIGDIFIKLHTKSNREKPTGLVNLRTRYRSLFNNSENNPLFSKAALIAHRLLYQNRAASILHGDIHHENIIYKDGRGWLSIDPKGLIGERTYDLANSLINPFSLGSIVQNKDTFLSRLKLLSKKANVDQRRLLKFAFTHACLSACWTIESGAEPDHSMEMAKLIDSLL